MFWSYQNSNPWSQVGTGILTDQSRLWLNALYNEVTSPLPSATATVPGVIKLAGDLAPGPPILGALPTVVGIQGKPVLSTAPADKQLLQFNGTSGKWEPTANVVGAWTTWTSPVVTPGGSMTMSSVVFSQAQWFRIGGILYYVLGSSFVIGGTPSNTITVTLPVTAVGSTPVGSAIVLDGSVGWYPANAIPGTGTILIRPPGNITSGNFTATTTNFYLSGFYRVT
jgi:hypothetical protein